MEMSKKASFTLAEHKEFDNHADWAARKLLEALDIVSDLLWVAENMHADGYEEVDRARQFLEGSDEE